MNKKVMKLDFLKYTLLNMTGSIGVSLYILADTYFIANGVGADGLTALNLVLPVFNLINGFGLMLGMGGAIKFSSVYCLTEREETDKIYTHSIMSMIVAALFFEILGLFFSEPLTFMLGADESIFSQSQDYLKLVLKFSPAFLMNNVMICFMRNDSAPKLAMAGMLCGSAANVILDYIYIYPMEMGMYGAALATCTAPLISLTVMNIHILTGWNAFTIRLAAPSEKMIKEIISLGFPSFITEIAAGIVIIVFNMIILRINRNIGVAAYGVVANIAIVTTAVYTGISQGVQPLMSKYHGLHDMKSVQYLLQLAMKMAVIISVVIYMLVFFKATEITQIFNSESNEELQKMSETGLRLYFISMPFMSFNIILSVLFTAIEEPKPAQIISLLRGIVLVIPLAVILSLIFSINGVWLTMPFSELIASVFGIVFYFSKIRPEN